LWLLVGVATIYGGPYDPNIDYEGNPLYCDCRDSARHIFREDARDPWVAVDVGLYESGQVRCGDELWVYFPDGEVLQAPALDAGHLAKYYVIDYPGLPIVVDVPGMFATFNGVSPVRVLNVSAAKRALEEAAGR
jgi:hypothetical protein